MGTLVYSPAVIVRIATLDGTIYDVSADVTDYTVERALGISNASVTLTNANRKYDGVFTAMDRIVIYQRRFATLLTFSGYLDQVPAFSTYPKSVDLRASCSAKRLQHFYWDPTSDASVELMQPDAQTASEYITDGGIAERAIKLVNTVMLWPRSAIHIASLPSDWLAEVRSVAEELTKQADVALAAQSLGADAYLYGNNAATGTHQTMKPLAGQGSGTGALPPPLEGPTSWFGGPNGGAFGKMALTGEPGGLPDNQRAKWGGAYYCAMRWPYMKYNRDHDLVQGHGVTDIAKCIAWWKARRILVVAKKTGKAVVVRPADWGPGSGGNASLSSADARPIDLSKTALDALGIATGDTVSVTFANDDTPFGPFKSAIDPNLSLGLHAIVAGEPIVLKTGWGNGDKADMVEISPKGFKMTVHKQAASRFTGFMNDLVDVLHYTPVAISSSYRPGSTVVNPSHQDTGKRDNHSYGAAIDIDAFALGNGFYNTPGDFNVKHKIPDTCGPLALKWGLWWGGYYHSVKDYMHFEVIGAPATPKEAEDKAGSGNVPQSAAVAGQGTTDVAADSVDTAIGTALLNAYSWIGYDRTGGEQLVGLRALMNDVPIFEAFDELMSSGLRHWCTAPNGDIIGWFPDYFGHYGTAAKMVIRDIEIEEPFAVAHSDDRLKTHMFVTSSSTGSEEDGDAATVQQQIATAGIASVEFPEIMSALFNIPKTDPTLANKGAAFLNRYGARPEMQAMNNITGPKQEFFFACFKFMQNWASQWSCTVSITFMPEIYPGMLLVFEHWGVQAYVQGVRHIGNPGGDGGFHTEVALVGWSTVGKQKNPAFKGLVMGAPL